MANLKGLTGLYPDPQDTTDVMDEGVLEAKANDPNPEHGEYGSQSNGYQGTVPGESPFAGQSVYDGWDYADANEFAHVGGFRHPGYEQDETPDTHSSPYPRGIIQDGFASASNPAGLEIVAEQMQQVHSTSLGGAQMFNQHEPSGRETETHYTTDDYIAPNENVLSQSPDQLRSSFGHGASGNSGLGGGNADPDQGYGVLNTMEEFRAGHSIRRVQHDSAVFDYTNTHEETDVPFYGRHPIQQMPLDGPDSPYFDNGDIDGANVVWEGRIGDPSPYEQPPEVTIASHAPTAPDVYSWGW
jgi:hypothetical protein